LASIPFFIEALRTGSLSAALLALALTTIALMMRMGSMFTIPALVLWLIWQFGTTLRERARVGLLAIAIITGIGITNYLLERAYGNQDSFTGSNFSYTLCGLTMGTTWDRCFDKVMEITAQGPHGEGIAAKVAYFLAWENFANHPLVFFERLLAASHAFLSDLPDLVLQGYGSVTEPWWFPKTLILIICLCGIIYILAFQQNRREVSFWVVLWGSNVLSAGFVFFDEGRRVLASTYPLIFLFFAMGLSAPNIATKCEVRADANLIRFGTAILISALFLLVSIPWLAHHLSWPQSVAPSAEAQKPDEAFVFGGRRLAGFLVLPDAIPLRKDSSSLHFSEFDAIIKQSGIERYQGLIHPEMPPLPFGFIFAPRLEKHATSVYQFIVPPEVMERRDVEVWRLHVKRWQPESKLPGYGDYWLYVSRAEPLQR
jgi:hypothetical protein